MASVPLLIQRGYGRPQATVNEDVAKRAFEVYDHIFNGCQSFEQLHKRGGFGVGEITAFLYAWPFPRNEWSKRVDEALEGTIT